MTTRVLHSVTFKVLGIAFLALLMLIPLAQVNDLIGEREGRAREATAQIAARWGGQQLLGGPVLVVPVRTRQGDAVTTVETLEYLLPDRLAIRANLLPEVRRYGLYDSVVYVAESKIEGRFAAADIVALEGAGREVQWARAELRVPIADVRGIRRVSTLRLGERELAFGPDAAGVAGLAAIAAPLALDAATLPPQLPFAFELALAGSERFAALPLARQTELQVGGAWVDPGFDGAFLPAAHRIDANGFEASWQVLDLNRRIAQRWSERETSGVALADSDFGVSLVRPAGPYQQNVRAGKYGVLFIALTFVAFFLFEVLRGLRVHAVQYLLVGVALCTFYVVLLALSEQIGFAFAYLAAATATVALIGGYAAAVLAQRRAGFVLGGLLALVYALLYGLVASEDYALLMGALALLAAVTALMYLTRRVDWYAMGPTARGA
ncbi:cell envelope integrity protein CreD [Dokdonella sp.]|uniref:cell envelope integrity protein CreD n=1 Tax=Dokdonella sp. TaxID=2291710 RepID=UPI001B1C261F|nr:cell envelope integrity protein CreD [Dokdonella sp.]MBO9663267.1 cell envelope integrity protein CreD [Dokdonella sp.]